MHMQSQVLYPSSSSDSSSSSPQTAAPFLQTHLDTMASSPTPSTVSAVNKVFSTFELLEHILLHLPLRQLLLAQRINKAASDVFTNSHNIRRALFLKAGGKDKEAVHTIVNPFLAV